MLLPDLIAPSGTSQLQFALLGPGAFWVDSRWCVRRSAENSPLADYSFELSRGNAKSVPSKRSVSSCSGLDSGAQFLL
jgi:hypothetical protein